jgi:nucleotide-binding universal stress UspA family protein
MKILVAVDGSEFSKRMLAYLAAHDEWLGNKHDYTVLTVVPAIPPRAAAVLDHELVQSYYAEEAEKVFAPVREFFQKQGLGNASFVHKVGPAADNIAKMAEAGKFDMVMMGTHGHGPLGGLVMGSTTTKVVAHCGVPVLLVR